MMDLAAVLLRHMRPTMEMLRTAIRECPAQAWRQDGGMAVQEHAYHCLYSMDRRFTCPCEDYRPPPFHDEGSAAMSEPATQTLDRTVILEYLDSVERRVVARLNVSEDELTMERSVEGRPFSLVDACLTHLRHVQHHVALIHRIIHEVAPIRLSWRSYLWG